MKAYITHSPEDTEAIGFDIAKRTAGPMVFALHGGLGSGKTVFTKGFARGLGIKETIQSPTFILMNVYPLHHAAIKQFVHVDCYRVDASDELREIGLEDFIRDGSSLVVIEWADKANDLLPRTAIRIAFDVVDEQSRRITISD